MTWDSMPEMSQRGFISASRHGGYDHPVGNMVASQQSKMVAKRAVGSNVAGDPVVMHKSQPRLHSSTKRV